MADHFRDVPQRYAFFGDCMISSTCLVLFERESIEMGDVEDMRRWPAIESFPDVSGNALFPGNADKKGDQALLESVMDLWNTHHIYRYTLRDKRLSGQLRGAGE